MPIAVFADDLRIPDDSFVYRRVDWDRIGGRQACTNGEIGKLSGNAFTDYPEEKAQAMGYPGPCMSVALGVVLLDRGDPPAKVIEKYPGYGLARIRVADLRRLQRLDESPCPQGVMASPTDAEPWHGVVFDCEPGMRKKAVRAAIARVAEWEIPLINR